MHINEVDIILIIYIMVCILTLYIISLYEHLQTKRKAIKKARLNKISKEHKPFI